MRLLGRLVGALVGVALAFPFGSWAGCGIYESTGQEWAQCGYEFEGLGHVILAIAISALILGWLGQWLVARLTRDAEHIPPDMDN